MPTKPKLILAVFAAQAAAGCHPEAAGWFGGPGASQGRYAGIGIYSPAQAWTRMVAAQQAKETSAARTVDDQAIIVTVDSQTGEVRSCGDMTGYCVGMNPWKTALASSQLAPIHLTQHAKLVEPEPTAASAATAPAASQ
jgi:hypothetical protein